jgi:glycosyltransferase involved in cell wall biosynthesis
MMNKTIVQIADFSSSYSGNFIAALRAGAKESESHGYRTVFVLPEAARSRPWIKDLERETGSQLHFLRREASTWRKALELARIARNENAAILHTHFTTFDLAAWMAKIMLEPSKRIAVVWHAHSSFSRAKNAAKRLEKFVKFKVLGRTTHMIAVSDALAEQLLECGAPPQRVHVIHNGIDFKHATTRHRSREDVRRDLRVPDDTPLLLGFGWTPIRKGVDLMLEAHAHLLVGGTTTVLAIVGTDELHEFVDTWPDESTRATVRVISPAERVGELLAACDVFLSPSRAEGFTYSIGEALLNGAAVACSDIPTVEWAKAAPGVRFCRSGDSRDLARAIKLLTLLPQVERQLQAESGRNYILEHFSIIEWAQEVWALHEKLLDPSASITPRNSRSSWSVGQLRSGYPNKT